MKMRCSKCSESCGDDFKTKTKYKEEKNAGDRGKVILLQMYDLVFVDGLQVSEVLALCRNLIEEHIVEEDLLEVKPKRKKSISTHR